MKKPKIIFTVLLTCTLLSACTEATHYKQDVQASLTKQIEMKNYAFSGDADIDLGNFIPQAKDSNPITTNLLGVLQNSKLDWNGVANTDPVQLEVDLNASPAVLGGSKLPLPMILKDNKLYMNIPVLNQKDEYYAIDLTTLGTAAGQTTPLTPESLKNVSQIASTVANLIIGDIQEKWFKKSAAPTPLKDGKTGSTYTIDVNDQNKAELSTILQAKLPEIIDTLNKNGVISAGQAESLKQNDLKSIQIEIPSSIALTTDDTGFIRDQQIKITFSLKDAAGATATHHLILHQSYEQINQNPKFTKAIPQKIKPFEDLLKLLSPKK
ncbi:MAG: hypothetical protein JWM44_355 [Bacilli bacterium]|nr:hypothetical protein [Bacilli bacterium]